MKKIIWVIIIIFIALTIFLFTGNKEEYTKETPESAEDENTDPLTILKNSTIKVPDSEVSVLLKNGEASFEVAPESVALGYVTLLNEKSTFWEGSGRADLTAVFAVNNGGSGTFLYLVLFDVSEDKITQKSEVFLGDRIDITNMGIGELVHDPNADYRISVNTLIRKEGEPFSTEPTIPQTRTFYITKQIIEEVEVGRDDT